MKTASRKDIRSFFAHIALITIFLLFFGEAYGITLLGSNYRLLVGSLACIFVVFYYLSNGLKYNNLDVAPFRFAIGSLLLLIISISFWSGTHNIYSYIGIPVAFLVYQTDMQYANKLVKRIVYLTFILAAYEYITHKYLFVNEIRGIVFDEKMMGGSTQVFRSKALFYGPTILGMFVSGAYLLNYRNISILTVSIISSFFANSRTGLLFLAIPFIILLKEKKYRKYMIVGLIAIIAALIYSSNNASTSIERVVSVADDGAQSSRIGFWLLGISQYINYPFQNLIFGDNGLYSSRYDNNPESGWICLLTDNGLVGFLFYLIPCVYCLLTFIRKRQYFLAVITCIFMGLNSIITYHLSGTGNLIYWLIMFELYNKARFGYSKIYPPDRHFAKLKKVDIT